MTGGNSYNDLREKVARLEVILGMTDDDGEMVVVLTQIQNINATMLAYRGTVDGQLTEFLGFRDTVGTLVEGLKKENEDLKAEVTVLRLAIANMPEEAKNMPRSKFLNQSRLMVFVVPKNWKTFCGTWSTILLLLTSIQMTS